MLPLTLSRLTRNVTHVRAEEFSDIRVYRAEMVVREIMMFGKSPEEARVSPMLDLLGFGFGQSIDMLADALGLRLDAQKATAHAMAVATAPIDTPVGVLAPGTVAAQRFTWQGTVDGRPVITVRVNWLMGERASRSAVDDRRRALRGRGSRRPVASTSPCADCSRRSRAPISTATPASSRPRCTA